MRNAGVDHREYCIMAFFHVIEDGLGNIYKLNHDFLFVFPYELGHFHLKVVLELPTNSFLSKVEHNIIELVRLELLYHLLDAVLLVLRNLIFKFVPAGQ